MVVEDSKKINQTRAGSLVTTKSQPQVDLFNHASKDAEIPQISVIMPAFNEEHAVGDLIDRTKRILQNITDNYEIIVVDDGSKDKTNNICKEKHVILIHNNRNCGKGFALRKGFNLARGGIIITIDSDGDHRPEEIPLLIKPIMLDRADVVFGSRFINDKNFPVTSAINTFGNKLFNFLIRRLTNQNFTDTQCGFRAFSRSSLSRLRLESFGYEIETEMIVQVARQNLRICEVTVNCPISVIRKSNIKWIMDGFRILFTIFKTRLKNLSKN